MLNTAGYACVRSQLSGIQELVSTSLTTWSGKPSKPLDSIHGWTFREWPRVLWTDESTFTVFPQGSKSRVWRAAEDVFDASCLGATVKHSPSRMFWGCFSWHGLGPLIPIHGSITGAAYAETLRKHAIPTLQKLIPRKQGILQEDNARPHRAKVAVEVRDAAGIRVLPWPAQSPDLNPIEYRIPLERASASLQRPMRVK